MSSKSIVYERNNKIWTLDEDDVVLAQLELEAGKSRVSVINEFYKTRGKGSLDWAVAVTDAAIDRVSAARAAEVAPTGDSHEAA